MSSYSHQSDRQTAGGAGLFQSHRRQRPALSTSAARGLAVSGALHPEPALANAGVDGGSEFRAEFEDACQTLNFSLAVLPPKSPQLNGVVETANDSSRTEFWNLYDGNLTVKNAGPALAEYQRFYNHVRPHYALDLMTPMEYLLQNRPAESGKATLRRKQPLG